MFEIEYKGANSVVISTKSGKILVDPKLSIVGLKDVPTKDAIELATEHRFVIDNPDARLIIDGPGDYGVAEFDIHGVAARRHIDGENEDMLTTMYRIEAGEGRIGVIGNIDGNLSDEQLEELGVLDVLIIPVGGGGYTLDATAAAALVRLIGPKVVIPVHHNDQHVDYEVPQGDLNAFTNELSVPVEVVSKYKSKQALTAPMTVVEITRS